MPCKRPGPQRPSPHFSPAAQPTRMIASVVPIEPHKMEGPGWWLSGPRPASACPLMIPGRLVNSAARSTKTHPLPASKFAAERPSCTPNSSRKSTATTSASGISQVNG